MKYVYMLESIDDPDETYVGLADDLRGKTCGAQRRTITPYGKVQTVAPCDLHRVH
jgi:hypothetical protein